MFAFSCNYRGLRTFLWIALVSIMVTGCDKNEEPTGPQPATEKKSYRSILHDGRQQPVGCDAQHPESS